MMEEEEIFTTNETSCVIKSDKNCEYKITFSVYNNDNISINISTINENPTKKFELVCSLKELVKNKFFKLFDNVDEVFRELETKIEKSSIIEETNILYLDIPIGLNVINSIILKIEQTERNKDEIIEDLKNEINQLKNENNQLKLNLNDIKKTKNNLETIKKELESKINEKDKKIDDKENELNQTKEILQKELKENEIKIREKQNEFNQIKEN